MPIWGKVLGTLFGFMFGRFIGAALGFFVGHMFDKGYSQDFSKAGGFSSLFTNPDNLKSQAIFFHALFSGLGHIAKADGQVKQAEIDMATALMTQLGLNGQAKKEAQQAFREGKAADFPIKEIMLEFKKSVHGRRDIMQIFLEMLIQAAFVDGHLAEEEQLALEKIANTLGFKQNELLYLLSAFEAEARFNQRHHQGQRRQSAAYTNAQSLADAYKILGVSPNDDDKVIKKAYRKLMNEHHPDKLMAKGLPKQAMEIAKNKAQDIQAAYEVVKKDRKI